MIIDMWRKFVAQRKPKKIIEIRPVQTGQYSKTSEQVFDREAKKFVERYGEALKALAQK